MIEVELTTIKPKKKFRPVRFFSCLLIPLLLLGIGGYYLYRQYVNYTKINEAKIQKTIATSLKKSILAVPSTDTGDPLENHPEANAEIPYSKTVFKTLDNFVFNFQFTYPTNTSVLVRNADGNQIWLLRRTGYMFKIDIEKSDMKLIDYYNQRSEKDQYIATKTKFGGEQALFLDAIDKTKQVVGNEYIAAHKGYIFVIWYQLFSPTNFPDDEKRVTAILQSFAFI